MRSGRRSTRRSSRSDIRVAAARWRSPPSSRDIDSATPRGPAPRPRRDIMVSVSSDDGPATKVAMTWPRDCTGTDADCASTTCHAEWSSSTPSAAISALFLPNTTNGHPMAAAMAFTIAGAPAPAAISACSAASSSPRRRSTPTSRETMSVLAARHRSMNGTTVCSAISGSCTDEASRIISSGTSSKVLPNSTATPATSRVASSRM